MATKSRPVRAVLVAKARASRWDDRMLIDYNGRRHGDVDRATRRFIMRAITAGLWVTSTTGGRHAPGSYHYSRQAADVGAGPSAGTPRGARKMGRFQRREATRRAARYRELFGPDNSANVKNGTVITLQEGSPLEDLHDNHVHGAAAW